MTVSQIPVNAPQCPYHAFHCLKADPAYGAGVATALGLDPAVAVATDTMAQ